MGKDKCVECGEAVEFETEVKTVVGPNGEMVPVNLSRVCPVCGTKYD